MKTSIAFTIAIVFLSLAYAGSFTNLTTADYTLDLSFYTGEVSQENYSGMIATNIISNYIANDNYSLYLGILLPTLLPPVVEINPNITFGNPPLAVHFSYSASDPDGGSIVSQEWRIENSSGYTIFNTTNKTFDYTFNERGLYDVYVTVRDDEGSSTTNSTVIRVCSGGTPDPAVSDADIIMPNEPFFVAGENIWTNVTMHNLGDNDATFEYRIDDTGKTIKYDNISIPGCSAASVNVSWNVEYIGYTDHSLGISLDPDNVVLETDEDNNNAYKTFKVYPGGNCIIDAEPTVIAYTGCIDEVASDPLLCPSGDPSICCGDTISNITASAGNPKFPITFCKIYGDKVYDCDISGLNANKVIQFSSNNVGVQNFTLYVVFSDETTCNATTSVEVTKTGLELSAPNVAVDRIELIPKPKLNYTSKIYAFISNNGPVKAENILINATIDGKDLSARTITELAGGGSEKVFLGEWTPKDTDTHIISVVAMHPGLDSDWSDNEKQFSVSVGTVKEIGGIAAVPEYPRPVLLLLIGLLVVIAYTVNKHRK